MFFDGSEVSNRANVNLRKTAVSDKNDFLKRTQQEREERLLQKLRVKSALKIQAVWRSHRILKSLRDERRQVWDQEIQIARQQPSLQDAIHIQELTRGLLFFYSAKRADDNARLNALAELWLQNILANMKKQVPNNLCYISNEEKMHLYIHQVKHLLEYSQQLICDKPEPHVRLLQFLLTPELVIFPSTNNAQEAEARKKLSVKITSYLVSKGLYKNLRAFVLKVAPVGAPTSENVLLLQFVMSIAFRPLQYHTPQTSLTPIQQPSSSQSAFLFPSQQIKKSNEDPTYIHQRFVAELLSIPLLTYRIANPTLIALLIQLLPIAVSFEPNQQLVPKSDFVYLLGNLCVIQKMLLQYYNAQIQNKDQKAMDIIINFLQFTNMVLRHTSKKNFYDKNLASMDPKLQDQLRALLDPEVIRKLFSTFLPDNLHTSLLPSNSNTINNNNFGSFGSFGASSFGYYGNNSNNNTDNSINNNTLVPLRTLSPGIIHVCGLYSAFSSKWKTIQSSLLNNLTFSTSVVSNIWRIIVNTNELSELAATGVGDIDLCNLLFLFCKSYGLLLFTASDDEFFAQTTFRLEELTTMISILKRAAFKMYVSTKDTDLREAITSLLQQLYDRNGRHSFSTESVWTVDDPLIETITNTNGYITDDKTRQILSDIPFVFPFEKRLKLFYDIVEEDKQRNQSSIFDSVRVRIRRNYVFEDGFDSLNHLNSTLKKTIRVELINSDGTPEVGIDGGGIFKEFLIELIKTAYNTDYGLFKETSDRYLYPSPASSLIFPDDTRQFEFLGKILAKAIFENIMVELPLCTFFLNKLLGKFNYVNDLVFLDPLLYKNLMYLKTCDNVEDLLLTFSVVENDFGKNEVIELMPGGRDTAVTNDNKFKYIALVANYKLNVQIKRQSQAFLTGFSQIIHPDLLRMFNQHELHTLISGRPGGIDIEDMKKYTHYSGGYYEEHPVVKRFWNVLKSFTVDQQRKFLMFVTSCSRPPLLGFKNMYPAFCLHKASHADSDFSTADDEFLPTASTCMNFLKLPPYSSESIMKAKITYAIEDKSGFQLS